MCLKLLNAPTVQCKFYFHNPLTNATNEAEQTKECLKRIRNRNRPGEEKITLGYLENIAECHKNYKNYLIHECKDIIENIII